jgi:hypothetical protein
MMTFRSSADLSRLHETHPAHPVLSKLADGLFSESQPVTIALLQSHDADQPLAELCSAEDVSLEGTIKQSGVFLVALQTDYGYGIVLAIPDQDWLSGNLRLCIEENLYN